MGWTCGITWVLPSLEAVAALFAINGLGPVNTTRYKINTLHVMLFYCIFIIASTSPIICKNSM